ncbi:cellulase family glycosylhydrolase [Zooshikella sp. RANM57]|uniref:cellulase family glycosylhydrolase n=1 Tax=Zooshikella sp. RANM57 TaxID=3425863 RepID=UPI003D6DC4D0
MNKLLYMILPFLANILHAETVSDSMLNVVQREQGHWVFTDHYGREVYWRGFNVSGSTKHVEKDFKPFRSLSDAKKSLKQLKDKTGTNIIRFLIAWEGVHPAVDRIDYGYLADVVAQVKVAIDNGFFVLVDYHQDLYSRHLFNTDSWHTGNGAPAWIVPSDEYPTEYCGIVCVSWSQHNLTNEAVRLAFRRFWENSVVNTKKGERYVQDEYLWQLGQVLRFFRENLSNEEFGYIVGIDPFNEPVDGGMNGLSAEEWDNLRLWPFYQRVRETMDESGWQARWVFAEPLVFWNTNVGFVTPATGGHHLWQSPGQGFVFNSHFYDAARMSWNLSNVKNKTYTDSFKEIVEEANFLKIPPFVSEFGMWLHGKGSKDTNRMLQGLYQGLSTQVTEEGTRQAFYSPFISSTQWHWDYYYGNHHELQNFNTEKLMQTKDAWNDEDFSVVADWGKRYNIAHKLVERAYPRRIPGQLQHFYFAEGGVPNAKGKKAYWASITLDDQVWLENKPFVWLTWHGKPLNAGLELYLPGWFMEKPLVVITEDAIENWNDEYSQLSDISIMTEGQGGRVYRYAPTEERMQFMLIAPAETIPTEQRNLLQLQLRNSIHKRVSPVSFQ